MMTWLRKRNKEILLFTFATFILGGVVFTGFQGFALTPFSPVVIVNGEKIPYHRFESRLRLNMERETGPVAPDKAAALKDSTLHELVQEAAVLQEADRYGLTVTDGEVAAYIQSIPAFQQDGRFDQNRYVSYVTQQARTTPSAFEEERRRDIRRQKLLMLLSSSIKISDDEARTFFRQKSPELSEKDRKELASDPAKLQNVAGQEQGNAVFQAWIMQMNGRLKVENRLDRWEKKA